MSPAEIYGVNTPLVTPHGAGFRPDLGALIELIDFAAEGGVRGACIGGTTGEFVHFSLEDRCRTIEAAARHNRLPVIAGVGYTTLEGALNLAVAAVGAGAGALLIMSPYFFRYSQEDLREFLLRFADGAPPGVPLLLYNIPAFTNDLAGETLEELLSSGRFAGIKDSSGSWDLFVRLKALRARRPFVLLVGDDKLYTAARTQGADGVVSGCAGVLPELLVGIENSILAGDVGRAQSLDQRLREFLVWIERFPAPLGIKLALAERGLPAGLESAPLGSTTRRLADQFRGWFREWCPVVVKEAAESVLELDRRRA
jgi:dihydrodipicolinate synthase/N-acetylneuraminate lyase